MQKQSTKAIMDVNVLMTNSEMTNYMAEQGYAKDYQSFIRGEKHKTIDKWRWIAIKRGQNRILNSDGTVTIWYGSEPTRSDSYTRFWTHDEGSWEIPVWIKMSHHAKTWHCLGKCTFSKPWPENHTVIKRGRLHHTTRARKIVPSHMSHVNSNFNTNISYDD